MRRASRPRAICPRCGRSTAVTFNKRTGEAYLRSHKPPPGSPRWAAGWCVEPESSVTVPRSAIL